MIAIELRPDVAGQFFRERIVGDQAQRAGIIVQQLPNKMERPWVLLGRGHGREPNLPIDPWLVRRDHGRPAIRIPRLGFEFIFLPFGLLGNHDFVCPLEDDSITFPPDKAFTKPWPLSRFR